MPWRRAPRCSGRRTAQQEATSGAAPPDAYAGFVAHSAKVFEGLRATRLSTSQEVAEVIFQATTETGPRLRYLARQDIAPLVAARCETSEERYMTLMPAQCDSAT
jgi:hypothetical protein